MKVIYLKTGNKINSSGKIWALRKIHSAGLGEKVMSAVGIDNPIAHLAGDMATYFNPVTGAVSSGIDAYEAAKKGNWGEAAVNTLFAIPFIGGAAKGVSMAGKAYKALNTAKKTADAASRAKKVLEAYTYADRARRTLGAGTRGLKNTKTFGKVMRQVGKRTASQEKNINKVGKAMDNKVTRGALWMGLSAYLGKQAKESGLGSYIKRVWQEE